MMGASYISRVFEPLRRNLKKSVAAGLLVLGVMYNWLDYYQTGAGLMIALLGPEWVSIIVTSPWLKVAFMVTALILIWRIGVNEHKLGLKRIDQESADRRESESIRGQELSDISEEFRKLLRPVLDIHDRYLRLFSLRREHEALCRTMVAMFEVITSVRALADGRAGLQTLDIQQKLREASNRWSEALAMLEPSVSMHGQHASTSLTDLQHLEFAVTRNAQGWEFYDTENNRGHRNQIMSTVSAMDIARDVVKMSAEKILEEIHELQQSLPDNRYCR